MDKAIQELMNKPLDEITEDIFLRKDAFAGEVWYGQLLMFTSIGVCKVRQTEAEPIQKALKALGYQTHLKPVDGMIYVMPGNSPVVRKDRDMER